MGKQANQEDWKSLYRQWSDRFLLFARQQTHSIADAEDVLQESMVNIWSKRDVFPRLEPGLVFTQIRRIAIDHARKAGRRANREQAFANLHEPGWFEGDPRGALNDVDTLIRKLPPEQQEVLVLKVWGEQTFESIGKTLDISPNTAASRYRYGLEQLRRELSVEESK